MQSLPGSGVKEVIANNDESPQVVIDEVNRQQGIGIIAHPLKKGPATIRRVEPMNGRTGLLLVFRVLKYGTTFLSSATPVPAF